MNKPRKQYAIREDHCPGEVLVIEAPRRPDREAPSATSSHCAPRSAAQVGIVTDGAIRDSAALAQLEIPAYHAAVHPAVLGRAARALGIRRRRWPAPA